MDDIVAAYIRFFVYSFPQIIEKKLTHFMTFLGRQIELILKPLLILVIIALVVVLILIAIMKSSEYIKKMKRRTRSKRKKE